MAEKNTLTRAQYEELINSVGVSTQEVILQTLRRMRTIMLNRHEDPAIINNVIEEITSTEGAFNFATSSAADLLWDEVSATAERNAISEADFKDDMDSFITVMRAYSNELIAARDTIQLANELLQKQNVELLNRVNELQAAKNALDSINKANGKKNTKMLVWAISATALAASLIPVAITHWTEDNDYDTLISHLESELTRAQTQIANANKERDDAITDRDKYKGLYETEFSNVTNLNMQLNTLQRQYNELLESNPDHETVKELKDQIASLKSQIDTLNNDNNALQSEKDALQSKLDSLQAEYDELLQSNPEIAKLQSQIADLKGQLATAEQNYQTYLEKYNEAEKRAGDLQGQISQYEQQIAQYEAQLEQYKNKVSELETKNKNLQDENDRIQSAYEELLGSSSKEQDTSKNPSESGSDVGSNDDENDPNRNPNQGGQNPDTDELGKEN